MALITPAEALEYVVGSCSVLGAVDMVIDSALGCVLAADVASDVAVPPFPNTAMDGYAVRAADTATVPCVLPVVATLPAGASPVGLTVGPGEAIRIMTGAPMPDGADAVVPVENTRRSAPDSDTVEIIQSAGVGDAVRPAGEDIAAGQAVFRAGTELHAGHLGVLASIGRSTAPVVRRPRVGVLSTGDELVEGGHSLGPGQIYDSNRHTLLALVARVGCEPVDLGLARDDEHVIEAAIRDGLSNCDALVTSGGVSMGDFDWVKVVLNRLADTAADNNPSDDPSDNALGRPDAVGGMRWMQIAIKPAKPLAFGVIFGKPVFGLPGNPVSSMVSFELFARPALRKMAGHRVEMWNRPTVRAIADEPLARSVDAKTHYVRVRAAFGPDGRIHVRSSGGQASNLLRAMALADALAVLPDGPGVDAGGEVDVLLLD